MNRFGFLAVACFALTIGLLYEGGTFAVHGFEAVIGIGVPRLVAPGLMQLALAGLFLNLSWLTLRGGRQQLTIARLVTKGRREHANRSSSG